jgi:DNA-binding NtrC family response regulator
MEKKRRTLPVAPATDDDATPARLRVIESGAEVALPVPGDILGVGSHPGNRLAIDDRYISAFHCDIQWVGARLTLRDRHSMNGTYVNGARVQDCALAAGTRVRVGGTTLEVLGDGAAPEGAAADQLVGDDPTFRATVELATRAASSSASVLIIGESGTGKELFARLLHERSPRAHGPFVALNCGAIPPTLVGSELFGHEKGAFTGAETRRHGIFEQADTGTLFLDEIGELPLEQQPNLLRVLETGRLRRVGAEAERGFDVRVVAATHKDLRAATTFRADLYHRLSALELHIPPLRARGRDVEQLAARFLSDLQPGRRLRDATMARLVAHSFPGNVRELKNVIHRITVLGEDRLDEIFVAAAPEVPAPPAALRAECLDDAIRDLVRDALNLYGSHRRAAAAIRMPKSTFYDKVRRYGLKPR